MRCASSMALPFRSIKSKIPQFSSQRVQILIVLLVLNENFRTVKSYKNIRFFSNSDPKNEFSSVDLP